MRSKKEILKAVAKFYGVTLRFRKHWPEHATVDLIYDVIYVRDDSRVSLDDLMSFFFHEYAHLVCKYSGKFPLFHSDELTLTESQQSSFLRTIWRAETYVDQLGKRMMKTHFPILKYNVGYDKRTKQMFHAIYVEEMKDYFDSVNKLRKIPKNKKLFPKISIK